MDAMTKPPSGTPEYYKWYHEQKKNDPEYKARRAATQKKTKAERDARYRENNRERLNEQSQQYRDENAGDPAYMKKRREYSRDFYSTHVDERRAESREYRKTHAEAMDKQTAHYRSFGVGKEKLKIIHKKEKLQKLYGLTIEQVEAMKVAQNNKCAICGNDFIALTPQHPRGKTTTCSVDHDHATGKVRELLCNHCNIGLGHFNDDPAIVQRAAAYLVKHTPLPLPGPF